MKDSIPKTKNIASHYSSILQAFDYDVSVQNEVLDTIEFMIDMHEHPVQYVDLIARHVNDGLDVMAINYILGQLIDEQKIAPLWINSFEIMARYNIPKEIYRWIPNDLFFVELRDVGHEDDMLFKSRYPDMEELNARFKKEEADLIASGEITEYTKYISGAEGWRQKTIEFK